MDEIKNYKNRIRPDWLGNFFLQLIVLSVLIQYLSQLDVYFEGFRLLTANCQSIFKLVKFLIFG